MDWLKNLFSGAKKTTGDAFNGVVGAADTLLNSDGVQKLLDLGAQYVEADLAEKTASGKEKEKLQASKIPAWAIPVGIGSILLLGAALILSRRK